MARRLVNFCLAWTLVLGCWGGVLAAAACPHVGCEPTALVAPDQVPSHAEHQHGEAHGTAVAEEHSAHGEAHHGHAEESSARDESHPKTAESAVSTSGAHDPCCSHCMGRPEAPPSSKFELDSNPLKKAGRDATPQVALRLSAPDSVHVREITPAQHAPPGRADRHLLLLNVFRI